jgi:serine/threonine-protein kinase
LESTGEAAMKEALLRCAGERVRTSTHLADQVAEEGARRVGILAILTAVTVVGKTLLQVLLQPEMIAGVRSPAFRVAALCLVLASVGLFVVQRARIVAAQVLLDLGLVLEVTGAFALGVMENAMPWPEHPFRGIAGVSVWIAICMLVIPNRPGRSFAAALLAAAMAPLAHLVCAAALGYPAFPSHRLAGYSLTPFVVAAWTPFISTRMYQMQKELSRATELGSYHLEALIGKGGMGEVWRASHRLLRRPAAVKVVRPEILSNTGEAKLLHTRQRFEQEAQAIASLRSPHTISLYDFGSSDDGSLYYAMELLEGMDADTLVERYGPLPAARVISILLQVCDSLEEAHEAGMVHRDVKPTNLFLCRLGKQADFVKLLDFGLVKEIVASGRTQLTMVGETSGTPAFMSPEQVRGELDVDFRADIYALGCVAYFLLTGELVFNELTAMGAALAHVEKTPVPPSYRSELPIPESLERVVLACLQKDRERRPATIGELRRRLEAIDDAGKWTRADANEWWGGHQPPAGGGGAGV